MNRFKNILVIADEASLCDAVIDRAVWLARTNKARLTFVDIIDTDPGEMARIFSALPDKRAVAVKQEVIRFHETRLHQITQPLLNEGLDLTATVLTGTGFIETIRQVLDNDYDLVLKGAHRGPDRPYLRAPDLHLLRKCPCPVWILNGEAPAQSRRMLAAVDPDPEDRVRDGLNRTVMELATSLARHDDAKLDVLNAWHVAEESTLRHGLVQIPEHEIEAILVQEEARSSQGFKHLTAEFADFADLMRPLHLKGVAADVVPEHVESEGIDTLVMGTLGRTGIAGFFIGNTAETILNRVSCSVIAVKPEGFVTPVRLDHKDPAS